MMKAEMSIGPPRIGVRVMRNRLEGVMSIPDMRAVFGFGRRDVMIDSVAPMMTGISV